MNFEIRSLKSHSNSRLSLMSGCSNMMTVRSKKFDYAIQAIPHQIEHSKYAYKDYFQMEQDDTIEEEPSSRIYVNENAVRSSKLRDQVKEEKRKNLALKIKNKINKTLMEAYQALKKSTLVSSTTKRLPTFQPSSSIVENIDSPNKYNSGSMEIILPENLVGTISKQSIKNATIPKSKKKLELIEQIEYYKPNIVMTNKLLLIEGLNLLQSYGHHSNKNQEAETRSQSKTFSILNQVSI